MSRPTPGDAPTAAPPAPNDGGVARLLDDFRALLGPGPRPVIAGLEVECLYRTRGDDLRYELREIEGFGGDFVDFFRPGSLAQIVVTIGDVRGKGIKAAARAIMAKYLVRAMVAVQRWPLPPGEALRDVAQRPALRAPPARTTSSPSASPRSTRAAATVASPRPVTRTPSCCGATGIERPLLFGNPALGVTEDAELQALPSDYVELAPGDALLFYTDGLSEARDPAGRFYEDARLDQALEELRDLPGGAAPRGPDRRRRRLRRPPRPPTTSPSCWSRRTGGPASAAYGHQAGPGSTNQHFSAAQIGR